MRLVILRKIAFFIDQSLYKVAPWINQFKSEESSVPPVQRVKTEEYLLARDDRF